MDTDTDTGTDTGTVDARRVISIKLKLPAQLHFLSRFKYEIFAIVGTTIAYLLTNGLAITTSYDIVGTVLSGVSRTSGITADASVSAIVEVTTQRILHNFASYYWFMAITPLLFLLAWNAPHKKQEGMLLIFGRNILAYRLGKMWLFSVLVSLTGSVFTVLAAPTIAVLPPIETTLIEVYTLFGVALLFISGTMSVVYVLWKGVRRLSSTVKIEWKK